MRIGIDVSQIAYEGTGVASYTRNLVKSLTKIDQDNEYVLFGASLRRKNVLQNFAPGKYFSIPPTALDIFWNKLHILPVENLIGKVDIFHSSDWTQPPTKAKKITTMHDLVVYKYPESSHPKIINTQKRRLEWVAKECDIVIADSIATKNDIIEILKIPEEKIRVVYLAAGEEYEIKEIKTIKAIKAKYNIEKDYILVVGTREPRKNMDRVIEAFKSLKLDDVDLVIAGKQGWGDMKINDEKWAIGNVKTLGYVPQEDLPALYSGATVFIYPSLYEGFGVPVLEAMSCGCPVITSNVSSLPEVGGEAAEYVDPLNTNDIAVKLLGTLKLPMDGRKKIIEKSLAQAGRFSWDRTAKETLKVYEELCGK